MGRFREAMCRIGNQQKGGYHNKTADREDKGISEAPKVILASHSPCGSTQIVTCGKQNETAAQRDRLLSMTLEQVVLTW